MEPKRWHRLNDIFHKALEEEPSRRASFLEEACGEDASLRDEVKSLLAYHDQAAEATDTPTHLVGAEEARNTHTGSLVGQTLHQYVVTRQLGQGGMGVVYLADDTRLGRPVAIKALSREFTQDAERRERLRREARTAAGLSHAGIATVFSLEEFGDDLYIVSESVPGTTLRDEVTAGPSAVAALLDTGIEIARALAVAHQQGVVHRDLKPENVMRTTDGSIKILDFGLARVRNPESGWAGSGTRLTEPGAVLGTPGYMPPEQLRGSEVDFRADIFSFGVLLYELASGTHPFTSSSAASTIARVLESDPPDITQLSPSCPRGLDEIIARCLQKEPGRRFGTTEELLETLQQLRRDLAESEAPRSTVSKKAAHVAGTKRRPPLSPVWWWQFHQASVGVGYYLMLIPLWSVRPWMPGNLGGAAFLCGGRDRGGRRHAPISFVVHIPVLSHRAHDPTQSVLPMDPWGGLAVCGIAPPCRSVPRRGPCWVLRVVCRGRGRMLRWVHDHRASHDPRGVQAPSVEDLRLSQRAEEALQGLSTSS